MVYLPTNYTIKINHSCIGKEFCPMDPMVVVMVFQIQVLMMASLVLFDFLLKGREVKTKCIRCRRVMVTKPLTFGGFESHG